MPCSSPVQVNLLHILQRINPGIPSEINRMKKDGFLDIEKTFSCRCLSPVICEINA